MTGRLIGIARTRERHGPQDELTQVEVTLEDGVIGDPRSIGPNRQVSVLFRDGWEDACRDLGLDLPWTTRRANLYLEGVERPRQPGGRLNVGDLVLEVMEETKPCIVMEWACKGLVKAMVPDWRGGVLCRVVTPATVAVGDTVWIA